MWLIPGAASVLLYGFSSIIGKKYEMNHRTPRLLAFIVGEGIVALLIALGLMAAGLSESGQMPWKIIAGFPGVIVSVILNNLCTCTFLIALFFLPSALAEAIESSESIFVFIGMILAYFLIGAFSAIREIFSIYKLIPLLVLLTCCFLLPFTESKMIEEKDRYKGQTKRGVFIAGILFSILAAIFDASGSLVDLFSVSKTGADSYDYIIGKAFVMVLLGTAAFLVLIIKEKRLPRMFSGGESLPLFYAALEELAAVFYLLSASLSTVNTEILWSCYPVVFLVMSAIFLKEKFNGKQKILLAAIMLSTIFFCIMDYIG